MNLNDDKLHELFQQYLPKIIRLAEKNLDSRYAAKFDADDVAATVCRTVFRRIAEGTFQFDDDESLWKQLVTITLRRLSNKIRHENAAKRSAGRTIESRDELFAGLSREPNPEDAMVFLEVLDQISHQLDDEGRRVLEFRMAGYGYSEIADEIGVSDRTVGRKIKLIRQLLENSSEDTA